MTDHLADARACIISASRSPLVATAVFWLTAACEQIIAHLEAQNTPQEATSADPTASQPEPDQLGRSDFMDWMADRLADPEVLAGYLAAHEREVREQIASELQHEAEAMARVNAHPAMADGAAIATAYREGIREGIRDGLTAAAHIALQEQP